MPTNNNLHASFKLKLNWITVALWVPVYLFSVLQEQGTPSANYGGAIHSLLLVLIVVVHGQLAYGWRGFGAYGIIVAVSAFLLEACSISTGFPFGYFTHHGAPGPAPLGVPVSVVLSYVLIGWFAWSLGRLIVRQYPWKAEKSERYLTPIIACFVLAGFDYAFDPIGATVWDMWSFRYPSGQFGVPLTNYLGWLVTGWVSFQLFALVEARFPHNPSVTTRGFWVLPVAVWTVIALQYPLMFANASTDIIELASSRFVTADIYEAAIAASLFSMLLVILIAIARVTALPSSSPREPSD